MKFKNGWFNRLDVLKAAVADGGFESVFDDWRSRLLPHWNPNALMGRVDDQDLG